MRRTKRTRYSRKAQTRSRRRLNRTRKAGMFRNAAKHARNIGKEFGKEFAKDIADKTFKSALKGNTVQNMTKLSSEKIKRAKSRLENSFIIPTNLSERF